MVLYTGFFIDNNNSKIVIENEKVCLDKRPKNFHCTMQYMPQDLKLFNDIMGRDVVIVLTGYGNNGENSGFKVQLPDDIKKYFLNTDKQGNLKIPHITTSLSNDGKAVNTANLNFEDLENPIFVNGRFGAYIKNGDLEYISFDFEKEKNEVLEK